jgi:single-strand DNA-binding protein
MHSRLTLLGRLTRDPQTKTLPSGKTVTEFSLAIDCGYGDSKHAAFIDCKAWEKTGEIAQRYLAKGTPALIDGRLDQENWEDRDSGAKRSKLVCVVDRLTLLPKGASGDAPAQSAAPADREAEPERRYPETDDDLSF